MFADLIDRPLAHKPPGRFAADSAGAVCAMITHNLLRAASTLSTDRLAVAPGATLLRQIVHVPHASPGAGADRSAPTPALALG